MRRRLRGTSLTPYCIKPSEGANGLKKGGRKGEILRSHENAYRFGSANGEGTEVKSHGVTRNGSYIMGHYSKTREKENSLSRANNCSQKKLGGTRRCTKSRLWRGKLASWSVKGNGPKEQRRKEINHLTCEPPRKPRMGLNGDRKDRA